LIATSAAQLVTWPISACGSMSCCRVRAAATGRLSWGQVRPLIEGVLDDRFTVLEYADT